MFLVPLFCVFHSLVEFDRIISRTLPVHDMELLVDGSPFDHGKETVLVLAEDIQRLLCHIHQIRLVGEALQHLRILQHFPVDVYIHRACMEQAQKRLVRRSSLHFLGSRGKGISLILECLDDIEIILALRAHHAGREITGRTAAHDDIRTVIIGEIILCQIILERSAPGMADHGSRSRIGCLRLGDNAHRHAAGTLQHLGNCFHSRIIQRICRGIFIDTHGIDHRFMTGGISGSGVCAVRYQRIIAAGRNDCIVVQLFHSQQIIVLAVRLTLGKDAGDFSRLQGHPIPYKKDDILCRTDCLFPYHLVRCFRCCSARCIIDLYAHRIIPGLFEGNIIGTVGNHPVVQYLSLQLTAQHIGSGLSVDGDIHIPEILCIGNLYVEIKFHTFPELCRIYRKNADFRRIRRHCGSKKRTSCEHGKNHTLHPFLSQFLYLLVF